MDLLDLIIEKRFLGQEFLTWLWFRSVEGGGSVSLPEFGSVLISFEKHLLLEYGEGDAHEKLICQGLQAELKEARTGLAMGKKLEQARIMLGIGDYEYHLTLKGSSMEFRSVKLPKTMAQEEEGDDPAAVEGRVLDRIGMLEMVVRVIDELFRVFLSIRIGDEWNTELDRMQTWIQEGAPAPR